MIMRSDARSSHVIRVGNQCALSCFVCLVFVQGAISFAPSYKYIAGTNMYDRRPDKKLRLPAWCDRIQWYENQDIQQLWYDRCELTCSDHKPVMALFQINVMAEVHEKKQEIKTMLTKLKDQECMPKVRNNTNNALSCDI